MITYIRIIINIYLFRISNQNCFTGMMVAQIVEALSSAQLNTQEVAQILDAILQFFPLYSLVAALRYGGQEPRISITYYSIFLVVTYNQSITEAQNIFTNSVTYLFEVPTVRFRTGRCGALRDTSINDSSSIQTYAEIYQSFHVGAYLRAFCLISCDPRGGPSMSLCVRRRLGQRSAPRSPLHAPPPNSIHRENFVYK